jgi:hypothetical protein
MHASVSKLTVSPTRPARERILTVRISPEAPDVEAMDAIARRVLERMLGHPPTRDDATFLSWRAGRTLDIDASTLWRKRKKWGR